VTIAEDPWSPQDLDRIGAPDEVQITSRRPDGTLRPFVTIWAVHAGDAIYIRSAYGPDNPWYRRALAGGRGRIRAGGVERDVVIAAVPADDRRLHAAIDAAYNAKYDRYAPRIVNTVVGPHAAAVTLRLTPAPNG
jgi:hypothetical protein